MGAAAAVGSLSTKQSSLPAPWSYEKARVAFNTVFAEIGKELYPAFVRSRLAQAIFYPVNDA